MGFQVGFQNITDFAQIGTKDMSFLVEEERWERIPGTLSVSGPSYFNNTPNRGIAQASAMMVFLFLDRVHQNFTARTFIIVREQHGLLLKDMHQKRHLPPVQNMP